MDVGKAASRVVEDKARGCITTIVFFLVAIVVYAALPPSLHVYYGLIFGAIVTAVGVFASLRGVSLTFGLPFLPLWMIGVAMVAFGFYKVWGPWGLFGTIPTVLLGLGFGVIKLAQALPDRDEAGAAPADHAE